jgi:hypothetical protein
MVRQLILGAINWTAQWYRSDGGLSTDEIADAYFDLLTKGMLAR